MRNLSRRFTAALLSAALLLGTFSPAAAALETGDTTPAAEETSSSASTPACETEAAPASETLSAASVPAAEPATAAAQASTEPAAESTADASVSSAQEQVQTDPVPDEVLALIETPSRYLYYTQDGALLSGESTEELQQTALSLTGETLPAEAPEAEPQVSAETLSTPQNAGFSSSNPGTMAWSYVSGANGWYEVTLFQIADASGNSYYRNVYQAVLCDPYSSTIHVYSHITFDNAIDRSGTYRFLVRALGSSSVTDDSSPWIWSSDTFIYTKPSKTLSTPSSPILIDGTLGAWGSVDNCVSYAALLYDGSDIVGGVQTSDISFDFSDYDTGSGISFRVRAVSSNICSVCCSALSDLSTPAEPGKMGALTVSLLNIAASYASADPDKARQLLDDYLDPDAYAAALSGDSSVQDTVDRLCGGYANAKSITTAALLQTDANAEPACIEEQGLALNGTENGAALTLTLQPGTSQPQGSFVHTLPLEAVLTGTDAGLTYPVRITLPCPTGFDAETLAVYSQTADGTWEQLAVQHNGDETVSFVLTRTGSFCLAEPLIPAVCLQLNRSTLAFAAAGETAQLTCEQYADAAKTKTSNSEILFSAQSCDSTGVPVSDGVCPVTVDETGLVTAVCAGYARITVSCAEGQGSAQAVCIAAVQAQDETLLPQLGLYLTGLADVTYTGKAQKPAFALHDGNTLLTEGKDYTVKWANNTNAGTASLTITGKGSYAGRADSVTFRILPRSLSDEAVALTTAETYTVGTTAPQPTVKYNGMTLRSGKDYTVVYAAGGHTVSKLDKTYAGSCVMRITGKGNYTGLVLRRFVQAAASAQISRASVSIASAGKKVDYTGEAVTIDKYITVKSGRTVLMQGTDYTLTYANNTDAGTASVTITAVGGSGYYGSKTVTFTIKGIDIGKASVAGWQKSLSYTGQPVTQKNLTLSYNGNALTAGDCEITYANNTNAGTAVVTLKGKGRFSGTKTLKFKITPQSIALAAQSISAGTDTARQTQFAADKAAVLCLAQAVTYQRGGAKPALTVITAAQRILTEGEDFTVRYSNCTSPTAANPQKASGLACATITGKGSYNGTLKVYYAVTPQSIAGCTLTADNAVYAAKGTSWQSAPVLTDADGCVLKKNTDYTVVSYAWVDAQGNEITYAKGAANPPAGTEITLTVQGKGCYTGTLQCSCVIAPASLAKAKITVSSPVYTGKQCLPQVTVTLNGEVLPESCYTVTAAPGDACVTAGSHKICIAGTGENYGGSKTVSYKIRQKSLLWWFANLA